MHACTNKKQLEQAIENEYWDMIYSKHLKSLIYKEGGDATRWCVAFSVLIMILLCSRFSVSFPKKKKVGTVSLSFFFFLSFFFSFSWKAKDWQKNKRCTPNPRTGYGLGRQVWKVKCL